VTPGVARSGVAAGPVRKGVERFAAGVVVVATSARGARPQSVAATGFNSVSLEPPLLLWSVHHDALGRLGLEVDRAVGLSVLSSSQAALVRGAAEPTAPVDLLWDYGEVLGVPLVDGAAAWFETVIVKRSSHGDHELYIGEVVAFAYADDRNGLLRYSGRLAGTANAP